MIELIGHRGASHSAPENTLESVQLAFNAGCHSEIDVQLTSDKKIVLMHDDTALRTGNIDRKISEMSWDELKNLDVGKWKGDHWKGVTVPLLSSVLAIVPLTQKLFIEIKGNDHEIIQPLLDLLHHKRVVIISFDHSILSELKKRDASYEAYMLTVFREYEGVWPSIKNGEELEAMIKQACADGIEGLNIEYGSYITEELVRKVHEKGLKLAVWTCAEDDTSEARREMEKVGVDYFTTNYCNS